MTWKRGKFEELAPLMRPGDVVAFGRTRGILRFNPIVSHREIDHVGTIINREPLESDVPDQVQGVQIIEAVAEPSQLGGVRTTSLHERLREYGGNVWWLPLSREIRNAFNVHVFQTFLTQQLGKPYDPNQQAKSVSDGLDGSPLLSRISKSREDFSSFFDSELIAASLEASGAIVSLNASEVTPADLCAFSLYQQNYYQLKGTKTAIAAFNTINPEGWGEEPQPFSLKNFIFSYPIVLGILITTLLLIGFVIQELLLNRFSLMSEYRDIFGDLRLAVIHCLLAGFLPAASLLLYNGLQTTYENLQGFIKPGKNPAPSDFFKVLGRKRLIVWGIIGLLIAIFAPLLTAKTPAWDPSTWNPEVWWHRLLGLFIGWWLGWFILTIWYTSTQTSQLAVRIEEIDLLDLTPLDPFVRQGLLNSLLVVAGMTLVSLFLIEPGQWPIVVVIVAICLPLAVLGLMLPLRGVHGQIRDAKQIEMEWIRDKIRTSRSMLQGDPDIQASGKLADQISYQKLIEGIQEWPIENSTILQVFIFLLIPLASWIGSLLIEGLLDFILG